MSREHQMSREHHVTGRPAPSRASIVLIDAGRTAGHPEPARSQP
jgi:hypothetical protein